MGLGQALHAVSNLAINPDLDFDELDTALQGALFTVRELGNAVRGSGANDRKYYFIMVRLPDDQYTSIMGIDGRDVCF